MKKLLLVAGLVPAFFMAQTANVTVSIVLHDIQSIEVIGNNVLLDYNSRDAYENGVTKDMPQHVKTFSTKNYFVKTLVLTENVLTEHDVFLNGKLQNLSPQLLFTGNAGPALYDVQYGAKGNFAYTEKPKQTHNITVVYSIEPQ